METTYTKVLRESLESLVAEHRDLTVAVQLAEQDLNGKRHRAEQINEAVRALRAVLGEGADASVPGPANPSDSTMADAEPAHVEHQGRDATTGTDAATRPERPVRIKSTREVKRIVEEAGQPMSREDIRMAFHDQGLVPPTWQHPVNAINNAIARAADRGHIRDRGDGRFVLPVPEAPSTPRPDPWSAELHQAGGQP